MAGLSASGLKTQIRSYTETDSNVLTDSVLENIILNAQYRIFRDVPIDADRKQQTGNLVAGQESINAPAGSLFIRGIQVYDSSAVITGANVWLEKKDYTYCCLSEAYGFLKGPIDMLTLYENKYKQEVQKFANEQVGRRRRDDYTDGAVRIPINSANP